MPLLMHVHRRQSHDFDLFALNFMNTIANLFCLVTSRLSGRDFRSLYRVASGVDLNINNYTVFEPHSHHLELAILKN